ncbi:MAG: hypothetical protein RLZZ352_1177 [Pseudomonadota bacterium]|jgi:hypothetical protein
MLVNVSTKPKANALAESKEKLGDAIPSKAPVRNTRHQAKHTHPEATPGNLGRTFSTLPKR